MSRSIPLAVTVAVTAAAVLAGLFIAADHAQAAIRSFALSAEYNLVEQTYEWQDPEQEVSPTLPIGYADTIRITVSCGDNGPFEVGHPFYMNDPEGNTLDDTETAAICTDSNTETVSWTPTNPAHTEVYYHCSVHPNMEGTVSINVPPGAGEGGGGGGGGANQAPTAAFTFTPEDPLAGEDVSFDGMVSTDPDGVVDSWVWDFGDGSPGSMLGTPEHTFTQAGTYQVTLTVTDSGAGADERTDTVTNPVVVGAAANVAPLPSFTFSPAEPQPADPVTFTDTSEDVDGTLVSWSWDFGDGLLSTERNPVHTFGAAGSFTVGLTVRDDAGATGTVSQVVSVANDLPIARFTLSPDAPSVGEEVSFDASGSSDPDGTIAGYAWDFGDGTTGEGARVTHAFAERGSFEVVLTVQDNGHGESTATHVVTVAGGAAGTAGAGEPPVAIMTASPERPAAGEIVQFRDASTDDGTITARSWDFGDGGVAGVAAPIHAFLDPGDYTVILTVTDDEGLVATTRLVLHVAPASATGASSASSAATGTDEGLSANAAQDGALAGPSSGSEAATAAVAGTSDEGGWLPIGIFAGFVAFGALAGVVVARWT